jgi:hypothetical protein
MIDAQTNPLLPADFIVPSPYALLIILLGRCFHTGWPLYKRTQRLRVRILGSVPFKHRFATQQWAAFGIAAEIYKCCNTGGCTAKTDRISRGG